MLAICRSKSYDISGKLILMRFAPYLIILLFALLGMKALFHPGLFTAHDIWHQVVRLYYYQQAINDGQFPPYWISALANGLGYPLFFFSYHLPWILGTPLLNIGFDISTTLKILFFIAFLFSGLSMYLFVNNLLKNRLAALLSSILYMWAPYHFLTILVGASMGIVFVFIFLPLVLLGIHLIFEGKKLGIPLLAISLSAIILSHLMHVVFLSPLVALFIIWEFVRLRRIEFNKKVDFAKKIFLSSFLGILISSFYLIPALYYQNATSVKKDNGIHKLYQRNFIDFKQMIYSKWGYGPIIRSAKDGEISFQLGIAQWISITGVFFMIFTKRLSKEYKSFAIFLLIGLLINIFLMLDISAPVWEYLLKFITLDYPFRMLMSVVFIGSVCSGLLLTSLNKHMQIIIFAFFVFVAIFTNRNHINVNLYTDIPLSTYIASEVTTTTFNEYLPIDADSKLLNQPSELVEEAEIRVSNIQQTTNNLSLVLQSPEKISLPIRQFYFPGQTLYIDGKKTLFTVDEKGRINFNISSSSRNIIVRYEETQIIKFAKFLTVGGILILAIFFVSRDSLNKKFTFYKSHFV